MNSNLKEKVVKGLIIGGGILLATLVSMCVKTKDDAIEAPAGDIEGTFEVVPDENVGETEVEEA